MDRLRSGWAGVWPQTRGALYRSTWAAAERGRAGLCRDLVGADASIAAATSAFLVVITLGLATPAESASSLTLVNSGSVWRYLDNGSNQGTAWRAAGFDDASWKSGAAELGYGDGDERTVVSYGPTASGKYPTTYFRQAFTVADATQLTGLTLQLLRDDGAVVYLNGNEIVRSNMPSGTIGPTTWAASNVDGAAERAWNVVAIPSSGLRTGANVIAVEVHQNYASSSDLSFDLLLTGTTGGDDHDVVVDDYYYFYYDHAAAREDTARRRGHRTLWRLAGASRGGAAHAAGPLPRAR